MRKRETKVVKLSDEILKGNCEIITDPVECKKLEDKERKDIGCRQSLCLDNPDIIDDSLSYDNKYVIFGSIE